MLVHPKDGPPYQALNSPFRWVGGKSRLRKAIIPLLPPLGLTWIYRINRIFCLTGKFLRFREKPSATTAQISCQSGRSTLIPKYTDRPHPHFYGIIGQIFPAKDGPYV